MAPAEDKGESVIELLLFATLLMVFAVWPFMTVVYAVLWKRAFDYGWLTALILGFLSTLPVVGVTTLAVLAFSEWTGTVKR